MYKIFINNGVNDLLFYDCTTTNNNLKLVNCNIIDEINKIDNLTFTMLYNHTFYNSLREYHTKIKVLNIKTNNYDFVGRILKIDPGMDETGIVTKNVTCESRLGYLCDSIQPYRAEQQYNGDVNTSGLEEFIEMLLTNHNNQVEDYKKIYVGNITLQTYITSDGVYKGLNYENTWKAITDKLINVFGGEIQLRESEGLLYLDYADKFGTTKNTTIELGKNLKSVSQTFDSSKIITRLIPLGAKQTDDDGNETENRLTVSSVNNDLIYVEDATAKQLYGNIYNTVVWDDVTNANNLLTKAQNYLIENNNIQVNNTVNALNLYLLDLDVDDLVLGNSYTVKNSLLGLNSTLRIIKLNIDVLEPYNSTFDMGDTVQKMSDRLVNINKEVSTISNNVSVATSTFKNNLNDVNNYVETTMSSITQSESELVLQVQKNTTDISDGIEFNNDVRNILSMDADGTTMIFSDINQSIETVGNTSSSQYNEIKEYIRFEDGNIILGKEDQQHPLTLTIENDIISFKKNGVVVSYWSLTENKFKVGNLKVDVEERAQLGNFAFVPRSNGSLSFLKVDG